MSNGNINSHANAIVLGLSKFSQRDAISILAAAISIVVSQPVPEGVRLDGPSAAFIHGLLCRRGGALNRIEKDIEVQEFIHSLDSYYKDKDLLVMIEERFGKDRTPSKSGLDRYMQRVMRLYTQTTGGNH